jgi:hypothetical protein
MIGILCFSDYSPGRTGGPNTNLNKLTVLPKRIYTALSKCFKIVTSYMISEQDRAATRHN